MSSQQKNTRQLILDAALDIIERDGMKALTQPRIAKVCGIRQSHLTYYFPRKADLYVALLDASHQRAEKKKSARVDDVSLEEMLTALFFEPERMRFFLSIILEVCEDSELQIVLRDHAAGLCATIAAKIGREDEDPQVQSFVDELRGLGLRALIIPELAANRFTLLFAAAKRHGLSLSR